MKIRYAEDYQAGDIFELGSYEVNQEEIIEFSRKYDPFPFHIDEKAAQETVFKGIISSGWLTNLIWFKNDARILSLLRNHLWITGV